VLPGKAFNPEDLVEIVKRRAPWALIPAVIIGAATVVIVTLLPNQYRSEALIQVVPQQVPESYVRSTVPTRIQDRLPAMMQLVLSRTRLEQLVQQFGLYADLRARVPMEDVIEQMRKDVSVVADKGDAFRVAYVGRDRQTVTRVADRLSSLFIEENLRDRSELAEGTNDFLETQLEDVRRQLGTYEQKLADYRERHSGGLPSQATSNLQALNGVQMQIQSLDESLNRDRDRKLFLERSLAEWTGPEGAAGETFEKRLDDLAKAVTSTTSAPANADGSAPAGSEADQLAKARQQLASLELRLKPTHPDVVRMKHIIADLEQQQQTKALSAPVSDGAAATDGGSGGGLTPTELEKKSRVVGLQAELQMVDHQIDTKEADLTKLRQGAADYQARLNQVPEREAELAGLTRDYATLQETYSRLLAKKQDSQVAANLERRQIGQQFRIVDPARVPERPVSPNRPLLNAVGLVGGLAVGALFAGFLEFRDASFRTEADVTSVLALPVLARVPELLSVGDHRRRRFRRHLVAAAAVTAMVLLVVGAVVAWRFGVLSAVVGR
jgi:polysaccharide chain length determinant protein (PEP-CTERM system associated)